MTVAPLRRGAWLYLTGDIACFGLFALSGLHSHHESLTLANLARAVGTFAVCWLAIAYLLLPRLGTRFSHANITAVFAAWPAAWALGFSLRLILFHRQFEPAFAVVSFAVLGLLLAVWRTLVSRTSAR